MTVAKQALSGAAGSMKLEIFIDGAARGNPGPAACGVLVRDAAGATLLAEGRYLGHGTNNFAEYQGLLLALALARRLGGTELAIRSDSELLVRQMTGAYKVKAPQLRLLWRRAQAAAGRFALVTFAHVPREHNAEADALANEALRQAKRDGRLG